MVQNKFVRREPEEYNWTDERFVPLKRKYLFIRQDNSKNPKKWGIINLVCPGISGFMYDFFIYDWKNSAELDDGIFAHLQKWAQVVAKLCEDFLVTKIMKCSLTAVSQSWISYITLARQEYMLLAQFDLTVCKVVLLMQTKNGRGTMDYLVIEILD